MTKIIFNMLFEAFHISSRMHSVKPFKLKNRDKIDIDATNQNLKKNSGWKVPYSSNKILPMKFYSSSLELSTLKTNVIVYRLGCRSKSLSEPFFRFGFVVSRSILSRFFDLTGFALRMHIDLRVIKQCGWTLYVWSNSFFILIVKLL